MSGHGANPIFCHKKIKIGCPGHSLTLHLLKPKTSHFCLTPPLPIPPQIGRHIYITTKLNFQSNTVAKKNKIEIRRQ